MKKKYGKINKRRDRWRDILSQPKPNMS